MNIEMNGRMNGQTDGRTGFLCQGNALHGEQIRVMCETGRYYNLQ